MTDVAVVVVGYDRPNSLSRLLRSLEAVDFEGHRVPLIISLDRSEREDVARVAHEFRWAHGDKRVRTFPQRLGLKQHMLACGELTRDHEHLIVLEDDLYVSPNMFRFARQAIEFYGSEDRVAGIGLYGHLWNVECHRPFQPLDDPFDAYFFQFACSWGQVWSRAKWESFASWYRDHGSFRPSPFIPSGVAHWSDRSWLKHHIRYCIETGRFYVYPRVGLSTNFSDKGQHNAGQDTGYQIPLQGSYPASYRLPTLEASRAKYDAFFESMTLAEHLAIDRTDLCVDLYGTKPEGARARYWLTTRAAPYEVVKSFDLAFRPHEANVIYSLPGDCIKLYDTTVVVSHASQPRAPTEHRVVKYDVRNLSYRVLARYSARAFIDRLWAKIREKGRKLWFAPSRH